jgi:glycosyltransferase involved in cell wall biosynthesis
MDKIVLDKNIKVVHLQYGSSPSGNYTIRQHEVFLEAGIDSSVLSCYSEVSGNPRIQHLGKGAIYISRINQKAQDFITRNGNKEYGGFTYSFIGSDVSKHDLVQEADYIYVHWVLGGFLSIKSLRQLAELGKPVIMVLHDMWTITGGCSYSFDCQKFLSHCHNCPILPGEKTKDISYKQFESKRAVYDRYSNLYFISPSSWLYNLAQSAPLTRNKPIFHIPNAIDTTLFKPFDKKIAKGILNINENAYVISFGANKITSPYKGWRYLQQALQTLKEKNLDQEIVVLVFGSGPSEELKNAIPFKTKFMGYITDDYTTNLIYNASDVFVAPSLADNLPTTIIESMRCGTAVVGFEVGGIPDMIKHQENGYLAEYKNSEDLARGIEFCMNNDIKGQLSAQFDNDRIIQQHLDLFAYIKNLS